MLDWLVMLAVKLLLKLLKVLLLTLLAAVTPSDDQQSERPSEPSGPDEKAKISLVVESQVPQSHPVPFSTSPLFSG